MFDLGTKDFVLIAIIIVLLFGGRKIPELTKGLIDGIKNLRNGFKDEPDQKAEPQATKKA